MGEPYRSAGTPDFDTYPAEPARDMEMRARPKVVETAEQIGGAVGKAVKTVRDMPRQVQETLDDTKRRFEVIRSKPKEKAGEIKEGARRRLEIVTRQARQKSVELRAQAEQLALERPIAVILGIGAAAFVLGLVLRMWRSE